ncbi:hypothetical protein EUGRSUZ_L01666 [Eucalyptus grandis]|uniref:WAT1-related protein n=2 Tax=Eucalyptus grandis TaxID=71139 RepID=A0AAD9TAT9_EUCGR|nr:hypothetical protein EUGRSUZ_L01666 [Eucalyptus grandis]
MELFHKLKHFLAVVFLQLGFAGIDILRKKALNRGMSIYVLLVYRQAIATLVIAPFAFFLEKDRPKMTLSIFIRLMGLGLLESVDQNMYYLGMKHTTATFAAAMRNIIPAITFVIAWIVCLQNSIKGFSLITVGCFNRAFFMILQKITLRTYPTELSLAAWICFLGTVENAVVALFMERGNATVWFIQWDAKLLAAVYSVST